MLQSIAHPPSPCNGFFFLSLSATVSQFPALEPHFILTCTVNSPGLGLPLQIGQRHPTCLWHQKQIIKGLGISNTFYSKAKPKNTESVTKQSQQLLRLSFCSVLPGKRSIPLNGGLESSIATYQSVSSNNWFFHLHPNQKHQEKSPDWLKIFATLAAVSLAWNAKTEQFCLRKNRMYWESVVKAKETSGIFYNSSHRDLGNRGVIPSCAWWRIWPQPPFQHCSIL